MCKRHLALAWHGIEGYRSTTPASSRTGGGRHALFLSTEKGTTLNNNGTPVKVVQPTNGSTNGSGLVLNLNFQPPGTRSPGGLPTRINYQVDDLLAAAAYGVIESGVFGKLKSTEGLRLSLKMFVAIGEAAARAKGFILPPAVQAYLDSSRIEDERSYNDMLFEKGLEHCKRADFPGSLAEAKRILPLLKSQKQQTELQMAIDRAQL